MRVVGLLGFEPRIVTRFERAAYAVLLQAPKLVDAEGIEPSRPKRAIYSRRSPPPAQRIQQ